MNDPSWLTQQRRERIEKARAVVVPFGKHKGHTLGWVLDNDQQHLVFLQSVVRKKDVRDAIDELMSYFGESMRRARDQHQAMTKFLWR